MTRREYVPFHIVERVSLRLPFWRYYELFRGETDSFLLDSASDPQKLGRYSIVGGDPFMVFRARRKKVAPDAPHAATIRIYDRGSGANGRLLTEYVGDPFDDLRELMAAHHVERDRYAGRPVPFLAGAVGYLSYEAGYFVEHLPDVGRDDLALPDVHFGFYNAVLVHCHRTRMSYLSVLGRGANERIARVRAKQKRDELLLRIEEFERVATPYDDEPPSSRRNTLQSNAVSEADYCRLVEQAKEHIFAGDIFEVCLTHRIESPFRQDPWDLYRELRRTNAAPFASFLNLPEASIVSSSPERFLRLGADGTAESRPIKGTRPRGATEEEDKKLVQALQEATKDQAENNMIVDLVRNDFGRVCRFGSVRVPELRIIERYATVHQMVSTIQGQLDDGRDAIDLLKACFPGGSMTGAPKVEAMKIIERLEPVKRSVYSGSIGYLDFSGPMDMSIVIRTLIAQQGKVFYGVGGAITADSDPKGEYQETMDKARALANALKGVGAS